MLFLIEVFLTATMVTITPTECSRGLDYCQEMEVYPNYPQCQCGKQYVQLVRRRHIPDEDITKFHTRSINGRTRFYICRPCSICEDGVEQIAPCRAKQNTMCGGCIKDNHVYDHATKTCSPISYVNGQAKQKTVTDHSEVKNGERTVTPSASSKEETTPRESSTSSRYQDHDDRLSTQQASVSEAEPINLQVRSTSSFQNTGFYIVVVALSAMVILGVLTVFVVFGKRKFVCDGNSTNNSTYYDNTFLPSDGNSEQSEVTQV